MRRSGRREAVHFSSTAAVYGNPVRVPVREDDALAQQSPLRLVEADDRDHAA
jgi:UDP-glucose 4-epimerase